MLGIATLSLLFHFNCSHNFPVPEFCWFFFDETYKLTILQISLQVDVKFYTLGRYYVTTPAVLANEGSNF